MEKYVTETVRMPRMMLYAGEKWGTLVQVSYFFLKSNAKRNVTLSCGDGDMEMVTCSHATALIASTIGNHGYNVIKEHERPSVHKMTQKRPLEYDVIRLLAVQTL